MRQVHYQGVAITITSGGYQVGTKNYPTIGDAKLAIYKSLKNSRQ